VGEVEYAEVVEYAGEVEYAGVVEGVEDRQRLHRTAVNRQAVVVASARETTGEARSLTGTAWPRSHRQACPLQVPRTLGTIAGGIARS